MHSQLMTRASRKAISFKPRKVIGPSEVVTDTQVSSEKPIGQLPVTSSSAPRRRSSSGQFTEKTAVTTIVEKHANGKDGGLSKIADTQTNGKANSSASTYEVKKPLSRKQRSETPKPRIIATMGYDLSLLGAGEFPPSDHATAQTAKQAAPSRQTGPETPTEKMMGFEEESIKSIAKLETPVIDLSGASIHELTSWRQKSKEATLQSGAGNAMKFEDAIEEIDVALRQVFKAKTDINHAAGDLKSLITHTSAQKRSQNTARAGTSNDQTAEASVTDMHRSQEQTTLNSSALAHRVNLWKPDCLCDDSILTYAKDENWDSLERNPVTGQVSRRVGTQEEGYFKAFGVLMGVRYVVVGSAVMKDL